MKKLLVILITSFLIIGCSYDYKVKNLKHRNLTYDSLPVEVKNCLKVAYETDFHGEVLATCEKDSTRYSSESVWNIFVHSWLDYTKVIDHKENKIYRIEQGVADPYIFYKDKIYIIAEYNAMTIGDFENYHYIEYQLKK